MGAVFPPNPHQLPRNLFTKRNMALWRASAVTLQPLGSSRSCNMKNPNIPQKIIQQSNHYQRVEFTLTTESWSEYHITQVFDSQSPKLRFWSLKVRWRHHPAGLRYKKPVIYTVWSLMQWRISSRSPKVWLSSNRSIETRFSWTILGRIW